MDVARQLVAEEPVDPAVAELAGRQADAVHDDQAELGARGALVVVRGLDAAHALDPPCLWIDDHTGSSNLLKCSADMRATI